MDDPRLHFLVETIQNYLALGRTLNDSRVSLRRAFDPDLVETAIALFTKAASENRSSKDTVLRNTDDEYECWYGGPSTEPNSHWGLLKEHLVNKSEWTEEMLSSLNHASTTVVSHLAAPKANNCRVQGLVLGYVQSGKSANFSAVIAKAVDAGYKLVIVLAGTHNNLRLQTERRLFHELCEPNLPACTNLTAVDETGDFKKIQAQRAESACGRPDGFALAVVKKNSSVLRNLESWLSTAKPETLAKCPLLLIDDESDNASVNTNRPAEENPTAINNLIRKIVSLFGTVSYVGYTATPFANIFIDSSIEDDLYPRDFLISLPKPLSYFGAEELFGTEALIGNAGLGPLPLTREVTDSSIFVRAKSERGTPIELANSLSEAILAFIIAGAARLSRNQWHSHITMLVHTSHLIDEQQALYDCVQEFVEDLQLKIRDKHAGLIEHLRKQYTTDFAQTSNFFKGVEIPSFDLVLKNITPFVTRLVTILDNSNSDQRLSFDQESPVWGIVIGGNTLSRGLTIEGLTVSYFVRGSRGYDTLMQMGRWFGYRRNYIDLTRIYVPEEIRDNFFHLACVEEELRGEIRAMAENKERPIDVALRIRSHPSMTVTSNLKMRTAREASLTYSGSKIQARHIIADDLKILEGNLKTTEHLIGNIQSLGNHALKSRIKEFEDYLIFKTVPSELILQFLDAYNFSTANIRFTRSLLRQYIMDLAESGELSNWSVVVVSSGTGSKYTFKTGQVVGRVKRSRLAGVRSERDPRAVYLTGLSPSADEIADLDDLLPATVTSLTSLKNDAKFAGQSYTSIRFSLRPKERGLLLLYPLETKQTVDLDSGKADVQFGGKLLSLEAQRDIFAATFVFPKSGVTKGRYNYLINGTV
jgi:hypothetical protein